MDDSKFNLWRSIVAFCHIDEHFSPQEEAWIKEKLKHLKFTNAQREIIHGDIHTPPDIYSLLPLVTAPVDRGMLVNYLRQVAHLDNILARVERDKIVKLAQDVISKLNVSNINTTLSLESFKQKKYMKENVPSNVLIDLALWAQDKFIDDEDD